MVRRVADLMRNHAIDVVQECPFRLEVEGGHLAQDIDQHLLNEVARLHFSSETTAKSKPNSSQDASVISRAKLLQGIFIALLSLFDQCLRLQKAHQEIFSEKTRHPRSLCSSFPLFYSEWQPEPGLPAEPSMPQV